MSRYELRVSAAEDLQRKVTKSRSGTLRLLGFPFEMGPTADVVLDTVESLLRQAGIEVPAMLPVTIILEDPSNESSIERLRAKGPDPAWKHSSEGTTPSASSTATGADEPFLPMPCPACQSTSDVMRIIRTAVPHFHELIVMSYVCSQCGYRSCETSTQTPDTSSATEPSQAQSIVLHVRAPDSEGRLNRYLVKSETASVRLVELDVELMPGTLGGLVTTVEGLLRQMHTQLSSVRNESQRFQEVLQTLRAFADGTQAFTLVLEDPLHASFLQSS